MIPHATSFIFKLNTMRDIRYFNTVGMIVILILSTSFIDRELSIAPSLKSGDIIFHTSNSSQSKAIQLATKSKYSHMGIIYETDGSLFVYEAVQPVKFTRLEDWIARGKEQHYIVKRLKNASTLLTKDALKRMKDVGNRFKGKNYDLYFEWSDERIVLNSSGRFIMKH